MRHIDADGLVEQHAGDVGGGAGAAGTELHVTLVGADIVDERLEVVHRQVLARDQHVADVGDEGDRREIGRGIVERLLRKRLRERMGADRAKHEDVTVRRGLRDPQRSAHAAAAGDVVDDHGPADGLAEILREDASEHVDRAAGRERHHHRGWSAGPVLRARRNARCGEGRYEDCVQEARPQRQFPSSHISSLLPALGS